MSQGAVIHHRAVWRGRVQLKAVERVAGIQVRNLDLASTRAAPEISFVVLPYQRAREPDVVDPSLRQREKGEIGREWRGDLRLQPADDAAEVVGEELFPQPADGQVVLAGNVKTVRKIAGAAEAAEEIINPRPAIADRLDEIVDRLRRRRMQRVVDVYQDLI